MQNERIKKILFVITKSNFGGAQRYVYELATNLPKDMFDVSVACGGSGILTEKLAEAGIKTFTIKSFERDINLIKEFRSMYELYTLMKKIRPDIVHLNSSKAGGSGALIARICGIQKIIFTAHGWPFHEERSLLWRAIVWFFSYITTFLVHTVIVVSRYDASHMRMPFVAKKCVHINTAIPPLDFLSTHTAQRALFTEKTIQDQKNALWVVTVAELTPNKNLFTAIEAVRAYNAGNPQKKIFYTIIGTGEQYELIQRYLTEHVLTDSIQLLGYVDNARAYLKAFHVFLFVSKKEGMPYALLEAGAAGLTIIASRVGGIPEVITDGENGILIDPHDVPSCTRALAHCAGNSIEVERLGTNARAKIAHHYALEDMIRKTQEVY